MGQQSHMPRPWCPVALSPADVSAVEAGLTRLSALARDDDTASDLAQRALLADVIGAHEQLAPLVDEAIERTDAHGLRPSSIAGPISVAYSLAQLTGTDELTETIGESLAEIDDIVERYVEGYRTGFAVRDGLLGVGLYVLVRRRYERKWARRVSARLLDRLVRWATFFPDGVGWWTSPRALAPARAQHFPHGRYDLGMADGAAGVLAFLCRLVDGEPDIEPDIEPDVADVVRPLITATGDWLSSHQRPDGAFPSWVLTDGASGPVSSGPVSSGWCRGVAGIAVALALAARVTGQEAWRDAAMRSLDWLADRSDPTEDLTLCHGQAGRLMAIACVHAATGHKHAPILYRRVFDEFVASCARGDMPTGTHASTAWTSFVGTGLTLASLVSPNPPIWTERLLMIWPSIG